MKKQNYIVGFVGMRGQGKSRTMRELLERSGEKRVIWVDTLGEHSHVDLTFTGETESVLLQVSDWAISENVRPCRVIPPYDDDEREIFMQHLCDILFIQASMVKTPITLVVDEVDYYCTRTSCNPGINRIIQYGRHASVNLVWSARSLQSVYIRLTSETNITNIFKMREPVWLDAIEERFGLEVRQAVENLPYIDPSKGPKVENGKVVFHYVQVNINGDGGIKALAVKANAES